MPYGLWYHSRNPLLINNFLESFLPTGTFSVLLFRKATRMEQDLEHLTVDDIWLLPYLVVHCSCLYKIWSILVNNVLCVCYRTPSYTSHSINQPQTIQKANNGELSFHISCHTVSPILRPLRGVLITHVHSYVYTTVE